MKLFVNILISLQPNELQQILGQSVQGFRRYVVKDSLIFP